MSDANYWWLIKKQVRGEFCWGLKQELAVVCSVLLAMFSNRNIPQLCSGLFHMRSYMRVARVAPQKSVQAGAASTPTKQLYVS